jgi:hypothetical protein
VGHTVPIQGNEDMKWFGFVAGGAAPPKSSGGATTTVSSTTTIGTTTPPTTTVSTPTSTPTSVSQHWGQSYRLFIRAGTYYQIQTNAVAKAGREVRTEFHLSLLNPSSIFAQFHQLPLARPHSPAKC